MIEINLFWDIKLFQLLFGILLLLFFQKKKLKLILLLILLLHQQITTNTSIRNYITSSCEVKAKKKICQDLIIIIVRIKKENFLEEEDNGIYY